MDNAEPFIAVIVVLILFVVLPGMIFHYITLWRKQKTLLPDDEHMLEDLWRSARKMEERIQTIETLVYAQDDDSEPAPKRPSRRRRTRPADREE